MRRDCAEKISDLRVGADLNEKGAGQSHSFETFLLDFTGTMFLKKNLDVQELITLCTLRKKMHACYYFSEQIVEPNIPV